MRTRRAFGQWLTVENIQTIWSQALLMNMSTSGKSPPPVMRSQITKCRDLDVTSTSGTSLLEHKTSVHAHTLGVTNISATTDFFCSNSMDESIKFWDYNGKLMGIVETGYLESWVIALSPDGQMVAVGSHAGKVRFYLTPSQDSVEASLGSGLINAASALKATIDLKTEKFVISMKYSNNGKYLAAGLENGQVLVVDVEQMSIKFTFKNHTQSVRAIAFSTDSLYLATGGDDKHVHVYDMSHGELRCTLVTNSWVLSLAFIPIVDKHNNTLASGQSEGKVFIWDLEKKECVFTLADHSDQIWGVECIEEKLITASDDKSICVYQITT